MSERMNSCWASAPRDNRASGTPHGVVVTLHSTNAPWPPGINGHDQMYMCPWPMRCTERQRERDMHTSGRGRTLECLVYYSLYSCMLHAFRRMRLCTNVSNTLGTAQRQLRVIRVSSREFPGRPPNGIMHKEIQNFILIYARSARSFSM